MATNVRVEVEVEARIVRVVLDRPRALNAFTVEMLTELGDVMTRLAVDTNVSVVVLTGAGSAFSAGVDLKMLGGLRLEDGKIGDVLDGPARRVIEQITTMPQIVIAAVNGHCFTGALEIALACDLVVVAEEAKLGDTHAKFGLRPTWGMGARLPRAVGVPRARMLSYTAATFTGRDAATWGLAVEAVPRERLDEVVDGLARRVAANSPGSLAAYKDLYRHVADVGLTDGLAYEAGTGYEIVDTEERIAGFR